MRVPLKIIIVFETASILFMHIKHIFYTSTLALEFSKDPNPVFRVIFLKTPPLGVEIFEDPPQLLRGGSNRIMNAP